MSDLDSQLDPSSVLDADRFLDYEHSIRRSRLVEAVLGLVDRPGLSVGDIGGASGVFLDEIARRAAHPIRGTVIDVMETYRTRLVNPALEFECASILDGSITSDRFDIVTARHVLHHLVADSVSRTLRLQERALTEMVRITRPGGYVVFEEEVNRIRPFSRAVYHLSRFANRHQLRLRYFETGRVVVSFMTPAEIDRTLKSLADRGTVAILEQGYESRDMGLRWKLTLLMASVGNQFYVLRKADGARE